MLQTNLSSWLNGQKRAKIFPRSSAVAIFASYITLFVCQGLLLTIYHRSEESKKNDSAIIVLFTEILKLLFCTCVKLYKYNWNLKYLLIELKDNSKLAINYLIPSFFYCLYNNLVFINTKLFDVTTYYCLVQFRIVISALIYQKLFDKLLSTCQWISLVILTSGCLLKEYGLYEGNLIGSKQHFINHTENNSLYVDEQQSGDSTITNQSIELLIASVSILMQMFFACFAGVYTEYLLKYSKVQNKNKTVDLILQNIYMYLDSILCNLVIYMVKNNNIGTIFTTSIDGSSQMAEIKSLTISTIPPQQLVLALIINNAASGLSAAFFLKSFNSIFKSFAAAIELIAIALLGYKLFGIPIDSYTFIATALISIALFLYLSDPVPNEIPKENLVKDLGYKLLPENDDTYNHLNSNSQDGVRQIDAYDNEEVPDTRDFDLKS